jgi:hypothetical protein
LTCARDAYNADVLERASGRHGPWYKRDMFGLACVAVGAIGLVIAIYLQFGSKREITTPPDLRVTIPLLVLALAGGITSLVRREHLRILPIVGVAMALASVVIGWLIIVAAVAAVAIVAILIIAKFT